MARRVSRLRQVVLLAAITVLLAGLAGPVVGANPKARDGGTVLPHRSPDRTSTLFNVPAGTLGFKSYLGWVYDDDSIAIVGEVLNNTTLRRTAITIRVTWFTSEEGGTELGNTTDTVLLDGVARGAVGPFVVFEPTPPSGVGAFQVEILSSTTTTVAPAGGLDITSSASYVDTGVRFYPGSIHNPNAFAVSNVLVTLTAYATATTETSAGDVLEVADPVLLGSIPAFGTVPYEIGISSVYEINSVPIPIRNTVVVTDGYGPSSKYVTSWGNYFDDLGTSSFKSDIIWLAEQGITKGCGAGRFCPDSNVRRDEMASFLARALGLTTVEPNAFTDDEGNTHEKNIDRIAAEGITTGCGTGLYCPAANVKRDQMASFLARALGLSGAAPNAFTDDEGNTHEKNIDLVAQAGVTTGCGATTYCPTALVTRGQMAAFLRRAFD